VGRNVEQNQLRREAQRAAILSSSLKLFVHRGFSATRIQDIAGDAGISQGLCYHYFPSKEDILVALLERALPRMDRAAKDLEAASFSAGDKIRMALEALIGGLEKNDDAGRYHFLVAVASASDALPKAAREILDRHSRNPYAIMKRIFEKGQKEGSVRDGDPRQMALVFWSLVKGLSIHRAVHGASLGRPDPRFLLPLFLREVPPCEA
jgi:AcrR family transcriptional regulator